jgi:DNA-binding response OmpR family regulator
MTRVLVMEDHPRTAQLIRMYFEREGYDVTIAGNGRAGIDEARRLRPELAIIDLMMPEVDGLDVCRILRAESSLAMIVVTARTDESDTLLALDLGADDYVTKPFRPRELVARARAVLRRKGQPEPAPIERLEFAGLEIDLRRHCVRVDGTERRLTPREFALLATLAREPGKVFSRLELLDQAFGFDYEGLDRTIDTHVRNLRRKVEANPEQPRYVQTVYGVGYRFSEGLETQ